VVRDYRPEKRPVEIQSRATSKLLGVPWFVETQYRLPYIVKKAPLLSLHSIHI
jgi:hypothetical protein